MKARWHENLVRLKFKIKPSAIGNRFLGLKSSTTKTLDTILSEMRPGRRKRIQDRAAQILEESEGASPGPTYESPGGALGLRHFKGTGTRLQALHNLNCLFQLGVPSLS